jgi:dihydrofolate synthase/folylpolyglutamate synthase
MTYAEALAYIASLEPRGWRLGLDRMTEFVSRAGLVTAVNGSACKYIHVAGTNGKGSVTAFLQSLLVESGFRTGAFFSPFVVDPRERVQIGRSMISREDLAYLTEELRLVAEGMEGTEFAGVTEFEFKTALGFLAWQRANTEWVALETGLGGRLDATNVVTPAATVIVSIGLDHQAILGGTLEEIAYEKAGIIKPGVPLILGAVPDEAAEVILRVAESQSAPVWRFGKELAWEDGPRTPRGAFPNVQPALFGVWQPHNLTLAIGAILAAGIELTPQAALGGATQAFAPGRYQRVHWNGKTFILDGAHNADSAKALAEAIKNDLGENAKVQLISNMLYGHEPSEFYGPLESVIESILVPPIDFHRARPVTEMVEALKAMGFNARGFGSVPDALNASGNGPVLSTGSFYLVGEVARALQRTI